MPLFTPPPEAPLFGDPAFATKASGFVDWQATKLVPELNTKLQAFGPGAPIGTVGGTANARTLTSGMDFVSLQRGQVVVAYMPTTNTGPMTLNVDGFGNAQVRTISGKVTPAGYIRVTNESGDPLPTFFIWTGDRWLADRQDELGDGFLRLANGYQECWGGLTSSISGPVSVIYPAPFATTNGLATSTGIVTGTSSGSTAQFSSSTTTGGTIEAYTVGGVGAARGVHWTARGYWYAQ